MKNNKNKTLRSYLFELMIKMEEACKEEIIRYLAFSGSEGWAEEIIKEAIF